MNAPFYLKLYEITSISLFLFLMVSLSTLQLILMASCKEPGLALMFVQLNVPSNVNWIPHIAHYQIYTPYIRWVQQMICSHFVPISHILPSFLVPIPLFLQTNASSSNKENIQPNLDGSVIRYTKSRSLWISFQIQGMNKFAIDISQY